VDPNGNVFVTGSSVTVRDFIFDPPDFATIKYSNSGVPLWTNRYDGPASGSDDPHVIAVDSNGNVFVTGSSSSSSTPAQARSDYVTIAYTNSGEPLWENRYTGPDNGGSAQAIAVGPLGSVFITGYTLGIDEHAYYTTIKYSSSVPPPVRLDFQTLNNQLVLNWTNAGFNLQTAPAVTGPFTNLLGATSPYTNVTTSAPQFFRLKGN